MSEIIADKSNLHSSDSATTSVHINKMENIFVCVYHCAWSPMKSLSLFHFFITQERTDKKCVFNNNKLMLKQHFTSVTIKIVTLPCIRRQILDMISQQD